MKTAAIAVDAIAHCPCCPTGLLKRVVEGNSSAIIAMKCVNCRRKWTLEDWGQSETLAWVTVLGERVCKIIPSPWFDRAVHTRFVDG